MWLLACLFSNAAGEVPPFMAGTDRLPFKQGRRWGIINDVTFDSFVWHLLGSAAEAGGTLTLDKNFKKGTLIDALAILRPYLPRDVIPYDLHPHLSTLQRIKTKHTKARRSHLTE